MLYFFCFQPSLLLRLSILFPVFMQLARNFEEFRKKYQKVDHELATYKDLLMRTETERSALDVKLKLARNQVDVELKRRQRAEADSEKLVSIMLPVI